MPDFWAVDNAAWRKAKEVHAHDGSAWRKAKEVWVHDGGAWRKVFAGFTLTATTPAGWAQTEVPRFSTAIATVSPGSDGEIITAIDGPSPNVTFGSPVVAGVAAGIHWKWTLVSGSANYSNTVADTWYPVGAGYYVGVRRQSTVGTQNADVNISFAYDSSGTGATTAGLWDLTAFVVSEL